MTTVAVHVGKVAWGSRVSFMSANEYFHWGFLKRFTEHAHFRHEFFGDLTATYLLRAFPASGMTPSASILVALEGWEDTVNKTDNNLGWTARSCAASWSEVQAVVARCWCRWPLLLQLQQLQSCGEWTTSKAFTRWKNCIAVKWSQRIFAFFKSYFCLWKECKGRSFRSGCL